MSIVLVGINHKTAPIEVRERLAFTDEACSEGLRTLVDGEILCEGLIVSTCNRVEVLTATGAGLVVEGQERITKFLSDSRLVPFDYFREHIYKHIDDQAVRHVFRVAAW